MANRIPVPVMLVQSCVMFFFGLPLDPCILHDLQPFPYITCCSNFASSEHLKIAAAVFMNEYIPWCGWQLQQIPGLVERMATLMCVGVDAEEEGEEESEEDAVGEIEKTDFEALVIAAKTAAQEKGERLQWLELDDLGMTDEDLRSLDLASKCPVRIRFRWLCLISSLSNTEIQYPICRLDSGVGFRGLGVSPLTKFL